NEGFQAVTAQSDAVLLDLSHSRQENLQVRKEIMRWQPSIRTLLQVQITAVQYLGQTPLSDLPQPIALAGTRFEEDVARVMRAIASEVSNKPAPAAPDIRLSAQSVEQEIQRYYQDRGMPVSPQVSDVAGLIESLASVLSPLYEDIHSTFAAASTTIGAGPKLEEATAQS